jgi:hypothetical protein
MDIKVEGTYVTRLVSVLNLGHVVVLLVTGSGLRAGLVALFANITIPQIS